MTGSDDYQSVLGIPPGPRPPNHYELLGLELFEADPERIVAAFQRRLAQTEQSRAVPADRLRPLAHEIVLAKTCLLSEKKADYDRHLNFRLVGGSEIMLLDPPVVARAETPIEAEVVASPAADDDEIQVERADDQSDDRSGDESGFDAAEENDQFGQSQFGDVSIADIAAEKKGRGRKPKSRRLFWLFTAFEAVVVACLFFYLHNRQQAEPEPDAPQFVVRPPKQPTQPIDSPSDSSQERQQRQSSQQSDDAFAPAGTQEPPGPSPDEVSNEPATGSQPLAALPQTLPPTGTTTRPPAPTEASTSTGAGAPPVGTSPSSPSTGTSPAQPPGPGPADAPVEAPVAPLAARLPGEWTLRFDGSRDWAVDGDMLVLSADEKKAIAALAGQPVFTLRDTSTKKPLAVMQYDVDRPNGTVYPKGIVPGRLLQGDYRAALTFNDGALSRALVFDGTGHCLLFAEYRNKNRKMFCLVERGLPLAVQIWRGKDAEAYWIDRDRPTPQAVKQSDLPAPQAEKLSEALQRLKQLEESVRDSHTQWKSDLKAWWRLHDKALLRLKPANRDEYRRKLSDEQHDGLDKLLGQF